MEFNPGQQKRLQALIDEKAPPPNPVVAQMLEQARELATETRDMAAQRDAMQHQLEQIGAEIQRRTGEARRLSLLIVQFDMSSEDLLSSGVATPPPPGDDEASKEE